MVNLAASTRLIFDRIAKVGKSEAVKLKEALVVNVVDLGDIAAVLIAFKAATSHFDKVFSVA